MTLEAWTPDRVDALLALNDEGLSASGICQRLGGTTRNAVIGKLGRLGLKLKGSPGPRRTFNPLPRRRRGVDIPQRPPRQIAVPLPPPQVDDVARVALADLEPHHCRFPVGHPGEPSFGFCGHVHAPGSSYCAGHLARCTVPEDRVRPARRGVSRIVLGDSTEPAMAQDFLAPA